MEKSPRHLNSVSHDTPIVVCPECSELLMVPTQDLEIGRRVGCPHCGEPSRLAPETLPQGLGRTWFLVPMDDFDDRY